MLTFAALISGSFSLGGQAAPFIDPAAINAARFVIAVLLLGVVVQKTVGLRRRDVVAPWRYLILGGLIGTYFTLMFYALRLADPVSTGAVFTLTPLMAAGFGWLFQRQVSRWPVLLALLIGAAGAIWVIFRGDVAAMLAFDLGTGEKVFLAGCACHAAYTPMVPTLNRGEPLVAFTMWTLVAGSVLIALVGWHGIVSTDWLELPAIVWITIAYVSVFATAVTFFLLQYAAMRLPAGKVMAYGYLVPSFVILWEGFSGHGWVSSQVWIGVAATIAALAMLLRDDGGKPARVAGG